MSHEINKVPGVENVGKMIAQDKKPKNYEGFEGMNYEQFRQPYNPTYKNRNNLNDDRKNTKRPEES